MGMVIDGVAMNKSNLFRKSMGYVLLPVLCISIVLLLVFQFVIKDYFRQESYEALDREIELFSSDNGRSIIPPGGRVIKNNVPNLRDKIPAALPRFLKPVNSARSTIVFETIEGKYRVLGEAEKLIVIELEQLKNNTDWPLKGQTTIEEETIFYAISPISEEQYGDRMRDENYVELYHLAYISESYSESLTKEVMVVFSIGLLTLILMVACVLFLVFKNISLRLNKLEKGAEQIGEGEFHAKISEEPFDEIGRLGQTMNRMGKQLGIIQEEQAENFQVISHELKTPIMVMQGYLDAMSRDQYPSGTREATIQVLIEELNKLEHLTKDILVLNKIEYLSKNKISLVEIKLSELCLEICHRLIIDKDISLKIEGEHELVGDLESWTRVIENIISNQLRYAKTKIVISLSEIISIKNDGPHIEENLLKRIKKPFVKGKSGRSGLGLAIVNNILDLYNYDFTVTNYEGGVEYRIIGKE